MRKQQEDHRWRFEAPAHTDPQLTEHREHLTRNEYRRRLRAYLATCPGKHDKMGFFGRMGWHVVHEERFRAMVRYVNPTTEADWLLELEDIAEHNPEDVLTCEAYHWLQRRNPALRGLSAQATAVVRAAESVYYWKPSAAEEGDVAP
jgi:hypothetical protein